MARGVKFLAMFLGLKFRLCASLLQPGLFMALPLPKVLT